MATKENQMELSSPPKALRVFISYSHQDSACALAIARYLSNRNYKVWIDAQEINVGERWADSIDNAIDSADAFITIVSKNSVRRHEVIRENSRALARKENGEPLQIIFITIGQVHTDWVSSPDNDMREKFVRHFDNIQRIQLDANGAITILKMQNLEKALAGDASGLRDEGEPSGQVITQYIYEAGMPEKRLHDDHLFYRVRACDLAPSAAFPFALDNQWLPDEIMSDRSYKHEFYRAGFESPVVLQLLESFQTKNLYLALLHSRQIIMNRASLLNSRSLQKFYSLSEGAEADSQKAFKELIGNGSLVVFLYGDNETNPWLSDLPKYETIKESVAGWNQLCSEVPMYCIRENWGNPIDRHSTDIAVECSTLAFDREASETIADCFGLDEIAKAQFLATLKEVDMTVFLQTHIIGTSKDATINGFSRSKFYENFVVEKDPRGQSQRVLNCIFDENKQCREELKIIIDTFYNSLLANYFDCTAFLPNDIQPEKTYVYQHFLKHGSREVSVDELEFAFSEFFRSENAILDVIDDLDDDFYIDNWDLPRIAALRRTFSWSLYVEHLEYVIKRSTDWQVDFSEIGVLVKEFADAVRKEVSERTSSAASSRGQVERGQSRRADRDPAPAYTFRISVGGKVLDAVSTRTNKKLKIYHGTCSKSQQDNLIVQFMVGDSISIHSSTKDSIFSAIKVFDGATNHTQGENYFNAIANFLKDEHNFILES